VLDDMQTSYFLSRDIVIPTFGDGMSIWREKLFASMHRNARRRGGRLPAACPRPTASCELAVAKVEI
jgi:K+ transporter